MLVDHEGRPLSKKELNYLPNYLGIMAVVTKKSVIEAASASQEPLFVMMILVTPQKLELYSEAEVLLQEMIIHNVLDAYVKKMYDRELKDLQERELQKYLTEMLNKYHIAIQPNPIPLDYIVVENVDEETLRKFVEEEKQKKLFLQQENK